jgi:hypothetical protein
LTGRPSLPDHEDDITMSTILHRAKLLAVTIAGTAVLAAVTVAPAAMAQAGNGSPGVDCAASQRNFDESIAAAGKAAGQGNSLAATQRSVDAAYELTLGVSSGCSYAVVGGHA